MKFYDDEKILDNVNISGKVLGEELEALKAKYDIVGDVRYIGLFSAIVQSCADKEWAGCICEVEKAWNRDTVYWDKKLVGYINEACEEAGIKHQYIHSGAGHDAQFASYMLPTTMIFVQSKDGLSHCEPEFSSVEHCTEGATVMLNAVLKADSE